MFLNYCFLVGRFLEKGFVPKVGVRMKINREYSVRLVVGVFLLIFGLCSFPKRVTATITLSTFNQGKGTLSADVRIIYRHEFWDWFKPLAQPNNNNDYRYFFTRSLVELKLALPNFQAFIQAQDVHMWGLPDDAVANPPAGPMGAGANYFSHGHQQDYSSTIIRQAYLDIQKLFTKGLSLRWGRFDYLDSMEVTYENPKVNWLKEMRLAERLIGPFTWSSFNRSFDGFKVGYDLEKFNLTSLIAHPTQGGFENDAHKTIEGIDLASFTFTSKYNQWIPNCEERFFYIYYKDHRNMPKVDNTLVGSGLNQGDIKIHTFGMHWLGTAKLGKGFFDGLMWGVYQTGDWGDLDHNAWAGTVEIGYQFSACPWTPWFRAGYFISSGDDDPTDDNHETFYQLLPTVRKYALFPFFNQMNNEDVFVQAVLKPLPRLSLRADIHFLQLQETNDRWYMGAGATRERGTIFGYQGRPSFGDKELGTLADITMSYFFNQYFSGLIYFGHVFGEEVIKNNYPQGDDANFGYVELSLTF